MKRRTTRRTRRVALPALAVGIVALATIVLVWLGGAPGDDRPYDPDGTSPDGGRALARLLGQYGVTVERVGPDRIDGDGLTLVTPAVFLTQDELAELPGDLLLVGQTADPPGAEPSRTIPVRLRDPGCPLAEARRAGPARLGGPIFEAPQATTCYQGGLIRYSEGGRTITVTGDAGFLTNRRLAEEGNAALAVNLTGARSKVNWLVPGEGGAPLTGRKSLSELIPPAVYWALLQLIIAVLVAAWWRGRRLGPVVTERLPVVVRAAETTEGRAGLYRAHRARDSAARALRAGFLRRVLPRLGLGIGASRREIASVLDEEALYGPVPRDDAELMRLAGRLDELERRSR